MKKRYVIFCLLILVLNHQIAEAQQNLAQQAYTIFEQHCLDCHGEFGSYADVLTIKHSNLIEDKSVIPRQPDTSEFYLRLLGDTDKGSQMPLGQDPLDDESIATIRRWIEAGAPDWDAIPKPKRSFISTEAMLNTIHIHVTSLPDFDRSFARYFTLTHLYNAGATDANLRAYRIALSKLINSLSWGAEVIKPKSIDQEETIFYIDLRNYEWDIKTDKWYKIEQAYPYGVQLKSTTYTTLCKETDCELPFIRADWFIATASLPPLYHDILDLPETDRELETQLEVNVAENLKNAPGVRVWRAGFNESGVSVNNRIVERHKSRYGAYWKSYDFAGNVGKQNIFTHPLDFTHDGGEIIFNLPNGLQAYYLSTAIGERLDEAPINIVSDAGARDPVVRNGLSCMGCHTEGMKKFDDQVRSVIVQNPNPPYDKAQALRLYAEKSEMDTLIRKDTERYRRALKESGGVFGGSEPIQQLVKQFEGPLDAAHAAAEVGLEVDDFLQKIRENSTLQNAGLLVLDVERGSVKRDAWESVFGIIAQHLAKTDTTPPKVVRTNPANRTIISEYEDSLNVLNSLSVTFSEPINIDSVTIRVAVAKTKDSMSEPSKAILSGKVKGIGASVEFIPDTPIRAGRVYNVTVSGAIDLYENRLSSAYNFDFSVTSPKLALTYYVQEEDIQEGNGKTALKRIAARPEIFDDENKWTLLVAANNDDYRFDRNKLTVKQLLFIPRGHARDKLKPGKTQQDSEVTFELTEGIKFANGTEVKSIAKVEVDSFRDLSIRLGDNVNIEGVTLMNEKNEKIHVRTCREYDSALNQGYYPASNFELKLSIWFKHQCGLLNILEKATIPQQSFISNPKVGIANLELLPFTIFFKPASTNWRWDAERDVITTYQKKVENGELIVKDANQNYLQVEEAGMGQWLQEITRADFNSDGIEDILLFEYHYATQGTLGNGGIIILTRKSMDGNFEVVRPSDPSQSSAHPYWFD